MSTRKLFSTRSKEHTDLCTRISEKPLLRPSEIPPTDPRVEVIGVFNPAFINIGGIPYLIARVDERPSQPATHECTSFVETRYIQVARVEVENGRRVQIFDVEVPESYDPDKEPLLPESARQSDPSTNRPELLLTYISHLRMVKLVDTNKPMVCETPLAFPADEFSQYGCEDPRATQLNGQPIMTYTAVGRFGATAWLAGIKDWSTSQVKTLLFGPDHKHSILFPERIGDYYYILTRPLSRTYISPNGVWLFRSPDLIHWGAPMPLLLPRPGMWDSVRVGPGATPLLTPMGWLVFYYGVDHQDSYQVGAALLHHTNPGKVLSRCTVPILSPIHDWERIGRRADTVFVCGQEYIPHRNTIRLYYGAADTYVGAADVNIDILFRALRKCN